MYRTRKTKQYGRVAGSDIALCVLSIPELLQSTPLCVSDDLMSTISPEKTVVLLNKADLAPSCDLHALASEVMKVLKVPYVWPASLTTSCGVDSFLREFGDVLKERSVAVLCFRLLC